LYIINSFLQLKEKNEASFLFFVTLSWVALFMGLFQVGYAKMGIDLGGAQSAVAQKLLDNADVGLVFQHDRGAGVPERMRGDLFFCFSCFAIFFNDHPGYMAVDRFAGDVYK
jgi:hypothetical protein